MPAARGRFFPRLLSDSNSQTLFDPIRDVGKMSTLSPTQTRFPHFAQAGATAGIKEDIQGTHQSKVPNGAKPERKLAPMSGLHGMKALRAEESPGAQDVYFNGPDCTCQIERQCKVEEQKCYGFHFRVRPVITKFPLRDSRTTSLADFENADDCRVFND